LEAWKRVPIATHRIFPNTRIKDEDFKISEVNVATGVAREYRGVMLPADTVFTKLQTKQTILEGQYVVTSAIQQTPDLRKGDTVKLELISGDLTLTTQAVTEEPGQVGSQVRVMTTKTKRELMGLVKADHSVEVNL
jgi:flagella basal body P-ring formation protein FlgA